MNTIFSLATAPGRAGVAIVRISGPDAVSATDLLCGETPVNRGVRKILDADGELIDEALILRFDKGRSFTGELVVELQLHGSPAIVQAVLRLLENCEGLRPAVAGEFTRRALDNGKLDLTQVEGLADLIDAETEAQRKQAVRVFNGELGDMTVVWRRKLIRAAALVEASIDFADEDIPEDVLPEVRELLAEVKTELLAQTNGAKAAERIREGFEVALVGRPNIGKSTLLNRLAGRDAAITSEVAGTTRDVIEVRLDIKGLPVTILDTAGVRETTDTVEQIGVERTKVRAANADLRVFLVEEGEPAVLSSSGIDIVAVSKDDTSSSNILSVSGKTGAGVEELVELIYEQLSTLTLGAGLAIRERHTFAMKQAADYISEAEGVLNLEGGLDILAESARSAVRSIDLIVGKIDVEDLLDEIFSSFCIGK